MPAGCVRFFRILACLLAVWMLSVRSGPPALPAGTADCPGRGLRFLCDGNRRTAGRPISPYDLLIQRHAARIGMDWRLLAAIIWHESQFRADVVSPMSAKGLMQLRDITALHFGYDPEEIDLLDPDTNVRLGSRCLAELQTQFRKEGMDAENALRFALASYNCGGGVLAKRRAEAQADGLDPDQWEETALVFARYSNTTPAYIRAVESTYRHYCTIADR